VQRGFKANLSLAALPADVVIATSSTRRRAQLLLACPTAQVIELRGNVLTRLTKLAERTDFDATLLAAAGLERLKFIVRANGTLAGEGVPPGLLAVRLEPEVMLPAVGQAAVGIEVRERDDRIVPILEKLNHANTQLCVRAERALLRAMGGGCASPIAAYAEVVGHQMRLRAVSFLSGAAQRTEVRGPGQSPEELGREAAAKLQSR
jgi:hydroxymethylbilane synthase